MHRRKFGIRRIWTLWAVLPFAVSAALVFFAPPGSPPTTAAKEAASKPAAPGSAVGSHSLANGAIRFAPPEGWEPAAGAAQDLSAAFVWPEHEGIVAVEILPDNARITAAAAGKIVQSLRATRRQRKEQILMDPTVEKDPRFLLRIHEKFKSGDKTADQLHLYREVGPRVVMVTVKSTDPAADDVKATQKAGEDVAVSAAFTRPGK